MITLPKKGGRHVWEGLDTYRPTTLLNTELKILARILANRLRIVISDLIRPEQNYPVKRRSIPDNLHLVREVLEELEDGTEVTLINLDQAKAFDMVDHWFLAVVFETAGFKPKFCKWISILYLTRRQWCRWTGSARRLTRSSNRSDSVAPCLLFSMSLLGSLCSIGLGIWKEIRLLRGFLFASCLREKGLRVRRSYQCLCVAPFGH